MLDWILVADIVWFEAIVEVDCLGFVAVISVIVIAVVVDTEVGVDTAVDNTVPGPRSKIKVEFLQHKLSDPQQK